MTSYLVQWEIDIEADSPEEAANRARAIQLNPENIATFFKVREHFTGTWTLHNIENPAL